MTIDIDKKLLATEDRSPENMVTHYRHEMGLRAS